jgi:hypothetical protein
LILPVALLVNLGGCPWLQQQQQGPTDANQPTDTNEPGTTDEAKLQVNFNPTGGNYAVATDKDGNQYSFRAHESGGDTIITEANIKKPGGKELKVSLDESGRPVNLRLADNTAADLVYGGDDTVKIRLTDATGNQTALAAGIKTNTMKDVVRQRRLENFSKAAARFQGKSEKLDTLQKGLETCEEVVASITDPESNPDSPLTDSALTDDLLAVGDVASTPEVDEVDNRSDLPEDVTIDEVPPEVQALAGQTYILFDAEGFCVQQTNVSNRLTFDGNGVLMSEFDRNLVFPDLNVNESGDQVDPGITINYATLTPLNLTPEEVGFDLLVTPIFTGTQLDDTGNITIERRFNADLTFPVELYGTATAEAHKLFDIAFINGALKANENGDENAILELDLVLVDLEEDNPVMQAGQLRYYMQGTPIPPAIYPCDYNPQENQEQDPEQGIVCPSDPVNVGDAVTISFNPGSADVGDFQYDWYISQGQGVINGSAGDSEVSISPTVEGSLEVTLLLHDMSSDPEVVGVYKCTFVVGVTADSDTPSEDELQGVCPTEFVVGEPGDCYVEGPLLESLAYKEWYVLYSYYYEVSAPNAARTQITFWETGSFTVVFEAYTDTGDPVYLFQPVEVVETSSGNGGDGGGASPWVGDYEGDLTEPPDWAQEIWFTIDEDGYLEGWVEYAGGASYNIYGGASDDGYIYFEDDAADSGYPIGIYEGYWGVTPIGEDGFVGTYYEDDFSNEIGEWAVIPDTGG